MRLRGTTSNRDAIGARVTVETDRLHKIKIVQSGSGFLSQHSKELLIGLGASERILKLTVSWPSGETQVFTDVPLNTRLRIVEGGDDRDGGLHAAIGSEDDVHRFPLRLQRHVPPGCTNRFRRLTSHCRTLAGGTRSLAALRGKPAIVLLWSFDVVAARAALETLGRGAQALTRAGVGSIAIAVDPPPDRHRCGRFLQAQRRWSWQLRK